MAQTQTFTGRKRIRKFFGNIREVAEMPNLIEVQKASYDQFLLVDEPKGGRPDEGLQASSSRCSRSRDFAGTVACSNSSSTSSSSRSTTSTSAASAA